MSAPTARVGASLGEWRDAISATLIELGAYPANGVSIAPEREADRIAETLDEILEVLDVTFSPGQRAGAVRLISKGLRTHSRYVASAYDEEEGR